MADPTSEAIAVNGPALPQSGPMVTESMAVSQPELPSSLCDIPQQNMARAPATDLFFSLTQNNTIPTDIFDGWQSILK